MTDLLKEGENLVSRVERVIGPWTVRIEGSLDENAGAHREAAALTSGNVRRPTESGDAFLKKFGAAWQGALEDFRKEWRRTRRWSMCPEPGGLVTIVRRLSRRGTRSSHNSRQHRRPD